MPLYNPFYDLALGNLFDAGQLEAAQDIERTVLARAVKWHLEDRIIVHGNKTVVFV